MPMPERSTESRVLENLNPAQRVQVWNLVAGELREAAIGIKGAASVAGGAGADEDPVIVASLWLLEGMRDTVDAVMRELTQRDELSRRRAQEAEWRSGAEGGGASG